MASKIKKLLKKVGKAALVGGLGYAAMKGLGGKKTDSGLSKGKKFLMSGAAGGARLPKPFSRANMRDIAGSGDVMPGNLSKSAGATGPKKRNMYSPNDFGLGPYDGAKDGGRIGKKSGGSVKSYGAAKRGISPILMKGRK
jgi:hypothetical protein